MPTAAAIYARISSDPEGDMLGVTRQVTDCRALAERRGWRVPMDTMGSSCRYAPDQVRCITGLVTKRIGTGARGSLVELNRIGQRPGARRATLSRAVVRGRSPGPGDSEAPGASGAAHRSRLPQR